MRLLDRYLLRELLLPFGFCFTGFLLLWTAGEWAMKRGEMEEYGLRTMDVIKYYGVKAPEFIVLLLPIALLLALLYTLNQHARNHELTAIRATGISLWRLAMPYFGVGLVASAALFVLNEWFVPDSETRAEEILRRGKVQKEIAERIYVRNFGFNNAAEQRTWRVGVFNLMTSEMADVEIIQRFRDGSQRWIRAKRAAPAEAGWVFFEASEFRKAPATNAPLIPWLSTNALSASEFTETPAAIRSEIKINTRLERLDKLKKLSRPDVPIAEIVDYLRFHPDLPPEHGRWLYTALHGRLAAPLKCIVVILIALPFGAASGRRNIFMGVAGSIFICIAFYFLQEFSIALGTGGYVPPWVGGWLPNIAFGLAGFWMTARVR